MDQSINNHNSLTLGGRSDPDRFNTLNGGEFSVFAMNRNKQRFIDLLKTWESSKEKFEERSIRDKEKEAIVSLLILLNIL